MYRFTTGELPSQSQGFEALVNRPAGLPSGVRWARFMNEVPLDAWCRPYVYIRDDRFPEGYGIYSNGHDGISSSVGNDPDDIASWRLPAKVQAEWRAAGPR